MIGNNNDNDDDDDNDDDNDDDDNDDDADDGDDINSNNNSNENGNKGSQVDSIDVVAIDVHRRAEVCACNRAQCGLDWLRIVQGLDMVTHKHEHRIRLLCAAV